MCIIFKSLSVFNDGKVYFLLSKLKVCVNLKGLQQTEWHTNSTHCRGPRGSSWAHVNMDFSYFCSWENWGKMKAEKKSPWFKWTPIAFQPIRSIMQRVLKSMCWGSFTKCICLLINTLTFKYKHAYFFVVIRITVCKSQQDTQSNGYSLDYHPNFINEETESRESKKTHHDKRNDSAFCWAQRITQCPGFSSDAK